MTLPHPDMAQAHTNASVDAASAGQAESQAEKLAHLVPDRAHRALARLVAIDWMRGLIMIIMVIDHASDVFNEGRIMPDSAWFGALGTDLTPDGTPLQFLTRWITHLCAPTFVFLAGTSLALSTSRRRAHGQSWREIDRHLLVRGLMLIAFEAWMSLGFGVAIFQVLYALGASMVCMTALRRLPVRVLLASSLVWLLGYELVIRALGFDPSQETPIWVALLVLPGMYPEALGSIQGILPYPLLGWLPVMVLGWVFGHWLLTRSSQSSRALVGRLVLVSIVLLAVFVAQRAWNGYGNFWLTRTDDSFVRWLQVSKYPPSIAFYALELGIALLLLAGCFALASVRGGRIQHNGPILVFGQSALFFYLLHLHLMRLAAYALTGSFHARWGLAGAYLGTLGVLVIIYPLCRWFRTYKASHPHGWARFF